MHCFQFFQGFVVLGIRGFSWPFSSLLEIVMFRIQTAISANKVISKVYPQNENMMFNMKIKDPMEFFWKVEISH